MLKKINVIIGLVLIISIVLVGCFTRKVVVNYDERKNIEFIVKMGSGEHWNIVKLGAQEAAKEFNINMNFVAPDEEEDIEYQEKLVNNAIDRKVDAIVLAAGDYKKLVNVVEKANSKKIPVITIDSTVDSNKILSTVSTDNLEAGKLAGERLAELVGKDSKVAIMSYIKESKSGSDREEGVLSALSKHKNIEVVAKEYCNSKEKLAYSLTKNIIKQNKELEGIVALNSSASLGAAQAIEELGLQGKIKLVTFDGTTLGIQYLEKDIIQATVVQNPFAMGYLGLKYAAMAARGLETPKNVDIESRIIDKGNIYNKENEKFVLQFIK